MSAANQPDAGTSLRTIDDLRELRLRNAGPVVGLACHECGADVITTPGSEPGSFWADEDAACPECGAVYTTAGWDGPEGPEGGLGDAWARLSPEALAALGGAL